VSEQYPNQPPQGPPGPGYGGPGYGGGQGYQGGPGYPVGIAFAGRGARLVAYIVDSYLVGIPVMIVLVWLVVFVYRSASAETGGDLAPVLVFGMGLGLLSQAYFVVGWARGGQTLGMKMLGIRVVRDRDGGRVGWGAAILRLIGLTISYAVVLGVIWIFIDRRRRGWHDLLAGTLVIADRRRGG
jgi:uncharacterized RDD family membrane protein YckC